MYSRQLKMKKMSAKLAGLNHCAVPSFKPRLRQLMLALLYIVYSSYACYRLSGRT